jgi:hypothetical protein
MCGLGLVARISHRSRRSSHHVYDAPMRPSLVSFVIPGARESDLYHRLPCKRVVEEIAHLLLSEVPIDYQRVVAKQDIQKFSRPCEQVHNLRTKRRAKEPANTKLRHLAKAPRARRNRDKMPSRIGVILRTWGCQCITWLTFTETHAARRSCPPPRQQT